MGGEQGRRGGEGEEGRQGGGEKWRRGGEERKDDILHAD